MAILQCGCNYPCRRYPSSSTESWPKRVPRRLRGERLSSDHGEISPLRERNDASVPPTDLGKNRGNKTRPDVPMLQGDTFERLPSPPCMTPSLESGRGSTPSFV